MLLCRLLSGCGYARLSFAASSADPAEYCSGIKSRTAICAEMRRRCSHCRSTLCRLLILLRHCLRCLLVNRLLICRLSLIADLLVLLTLRILSVLDICRLLGRCLLSGGLFLLFGHDCLDDDSGDHKYQGENTADPISASNTLAVASNSILRCLPVLFRRSQPFR